MFAARQSTRAVAGATTRAMGGLRNKSDLVTLEKRGAIAILRLNDPKKMNPMTKPFGEALKARIEEVNARADEFGAVVLTGEGRAFCAGGDLNFLQHRKVDSATRNTAIMRDFYEYFLPLRSLEMPTVAAINGPAIGAGLSIALFCDMRVAAHDAKMGVTFVTLGLHPGMGTSHFLPQIVGPEQANYLMLTGKTIDGVEAERIRLVSKAVPADQLVDEAVKLAEELAAPSATAVRAVVRTIRLKQDIGLDAALQREADAQAHTYASPDYAEGVKALLERRKPNFQPLESFKY